MKSFRNAFLSLPFVCAGALVWSGVVVVAHHSSAAFDTQKEVTINGTVRSYRFTNPHVQLVVTVRKEDGSTVDVEVEAGAASVLNGLGFTRDSLKVGEQVTITGNPARRAPDREMLGKDLYKKDTKVTKVGLEFFVIFVPFVAERPSCPCG